MVKTAHFGKIDSYLLFGGTRLVADLASGLQKRNVSVRIFAGPRHLQDKVDAKNTLAELLKARKISFFSSADINSEAELDTLLEKTTMGVLAGAAWDFTPETIAKFDGRLVEIMPIPLPQYRGGAHQTHQILRNDHNWSVSMQWVTTEKHKGPLLMEHPIKLGQTATPQAYMDDVAKACEELFFDFIKGVQAVKTFSPKPLDESASMHFPFLYTKTHGFIDWGCWTAQEIHAFITAFGEPYVGASTFCNGVRVFLKDCTQVPQDGYFHPFQAGIVYRKTEKGLFVAARGGALLIGHVTDEQGQNAMDSIKEGDRLFTPREHIEAALGFSARYDAKGLKK